VNPAITFRRLRRRDFGLLGTWLAEPLVARWWNHDSSPEGVEGDFGATVDGTDPAEIFLACIDGRPFGLIQRYLIDGEPGYAAELRTLCDVPARALSIDYLVGEASLRGRGLGAAMIAELVAASWGAVADVPAVIVPVAAANQRSRRALERAGFRRIGEGELTPDNPIDPPDHVVYRIDRPG
jgi:aminoglycoside 6'-N-acetyltransferase